MPRPSEGRQGCPTGRAERVQDGRGLFPNRRLLVSEPRDQGLERLDGVGPEIAELPHRVESYQPARVIDLVSEDARGHAGLAEHALERHDGALVHLLPPPAPRARPDPLPGHEEDFHQLRLGASRRGADLPEPVHDEARAESPRLILPVEPLPQQRLEYGSGTARSHPGQSPQGRLGLAAGFCEELEVIALRRPPSQGATALEPRGRGPALLRREALELLDAPELDEEVAQEKDHDDRRGPGHPDVQSTQGARASRHGKPPVGSFSSTPDSKGERSRSLGAARRCARRVIPAANPRPQNSRSAPATAGLAGPSKSFLPPGARSLS